MKIANICFREGYNIPGPGASGWDTRWASLGSVALAIPTPTDQRFTFTSTWQQAHISPRSLFSVSSPHPSYCSSLSDKLRIYPINPLSIHLDLEHPPSSSVFLLHVMFTQKKNLKLQHKSKYCSIRSINIKLHRH